MPVAGPSSLVFVGGRGEALSKFGMAVLLRQHLETIGLKAERPELFVTTNEPHPMRVHDLRGTSVTLSLAAGRSESWIADRTGHRSSAMINRYKRTARSFAELNLGSPAPLVEAIVELAQLVPQDSEPSPEATRPSGGWASGWAKYSESSGNIGVPNGIRTRVTALKGPCPGPG